MIKRFLNNPIVVICLVLVAFGVVFQKVLSPYVWKNTPENISQMVNLMEEDEDENPLSENQNSGTSIDLEKLKWMYSSVRDPFRTFETEVTTKKTMRGKALSVSINNILSDKLVKKQEAGTQESAKHKKNITIPTADKKFRLTAVLIEPGIKFATLNEAMVLEGDTIESYKIIRIESSQVVLEGPLGQETLLFE